MHPSGIANLPPLEHSKPYKEIKMSQAKKNASRRKKRGGQVKRFVSGKWQVIVRERLNDERIYEFNDRGSALSFTEYQHERNKVCWVTGPNGENPSR